MRKREPVEYTEPQLVLIPVLIEAVCVTITVCCAIVAVALLSKPWPV